MSLVAEGSSGITVAQTLSSLSVSYRVLGGDRGLDRMVTDIVVAGSHHLGVFPSHTLVVLDAASLHNDTYQVDLALKAVATADGSALLLVSQHGVEVGLAPARLANKMGVPLIAVDGVETLSFVDQTRQTVTAPSLVAAKMILESMLTIRRSSHRSNPDLLLGDLRARTGASITVVDFDGTVVAGAPLHPPLGEADRLAVPMTSRRETVAQMVQPVVLAPNERPSFWLVCRQDDATPAWLTAMGGVLQMAAWAVGMRLASERLDRERDARFRFGLLNQITSSGDSPEPGMMEQIGMLGWQVDGWCSAIHVQASGVNLQERLLLLTDDLERNLKSADIVAPVIERPDGWTLWAHEPKEPPPSTYAQMVRKLTAVASRFSAAHPGIGLHIGIGLPRQALKGLRQSLAEAREASLIAQAGGGTAVVEHIDEVGVRRMLFGWYTSENFAEFAHTLTQSLRAADAHGELMLTLEVYLDSQGSSAQTAAAMGLHRNTVLNRMEKIRSLLSVDLERPDERLAVHLACRLLRLRAQGE